MNLQVLVASMYQNDYSLIEKMNLQSDAIIINQCNENKFEKIDYEDKTINFISLNERGVGLSRNNSLMRATADICVFADEDVTYVDGYKEIILDAFKNNPDADMILFNVPSKNPKRPTHIISKNKRVRCFNCLRYGAVKIAVRTERIRHANVYFSLNFGGGAKYGSGEDSLFIMQCIRSGIKVYTNTNIIGYVSQEESSWFKGYDEKYFIDKGKLFEAIFKRWRKVLSLQFCIRHRRMFKESIKWQDAYKLMIKND